MFALIIIFLHATGNPTFSTKVPVYPSEEACKNAKQFIAPYLQGKLEASEPGIVVGATCTAVELVDTKST